MSDLISKKIAVQGVRELFSMGDCYCDELSIVGMLNSLKPEEPERKKGKWVWRKDRDCHECSECKAVLEEDDIKTHNFYYCYHCGADMRTSYGWVNIEN